MLCTWVEVAVRKSLEFLVTVFTERNMCMLWGGVLATCVEAMKFSGSTSATSEEKSRETNPSRQLAAPDGWEGARRHSDLGFAPSRNYNFVLAKFAILRHRPTMVSFSLSWSPRLFKNVIWQPRSATPASAAFAAPWDSCRHRSQWKSRSR